MKPIKIAELMLEKKANDIKIFDVKNITTMTDHFIVCSSDSEPQTKAIANNIERTLKKNGIKPTNIEGQNKLEWILMDYITFIIHIFRSDKRQFYDLDRLWADAKITSIKDKDEK
ncbi:MAG: ribosome silencing factor [Candidatus Marinimicrobia bacterium]|nr:ribosome silencing factor [Candidatus Neomarinimicrobiota bacterium]|tara:strand:+ start:7028 stop:7372 length:345 start_codon:yes stop_codon:yes gene_type:complete